MKHKMQQLSGIMLAAFAAISTSTAVSENRVWLHVHSSERAECNAVKFLQDAKTRFARKIPNDWISQEMKRDGDGNYWAIVGDVRGSGESEILRAVITENCSREDGLADGSVNTNLVLNIMIVRPYSGNHSFFRWCSDTGNVTYGCTNWLSAQKHDWVKGMNLNVRAVGMQNKPGEGKGETK